METLKWKQDQGEKKKKSTHLPYAMENSYIKVNIVDWSSTGRCGKKGNWTETRVDSSKHCYFTHQVKITKF